MGLSRRAISVITLVAVSFLASFTMSRLNDAVSQPHLVPGPLDARGFRVKAVDAETGAAVRYNPCEPLHYVINPALAPDGAIDDMHTAIRLTSEASGLKFVYDGTTEEVDLGTIRPTHQPDLYGERWAPILISWTNGLPATDTAADAEGRRPIAAAGSNYEINDEGQAVYITGSAAFDATVTDLQPGFGGETWGQAMLHELGHVVGLDHVDDPASVMNPVIGRRAASWGGADRAGLWSQGIGSPCIKTPDLP
ncbi:MAG: matrixin family metalloprotease [Actinomycetota bacterium]